MASNRLPLFTLLAANAISFTGNALAMVAIPWFVLETTGSASRTGLTAAVVAVAAILAAVIGGGAVDRLGYRRMSIVSDVASAVPVALVPALYYTTGIAFWQLLVLVFLGALLDTPGNSARLALLPELAERAGMPLERANAAMQSIQRGASLAGAPLAGLLVALFGAANVLLVDAATFVVSAALVAFAVPATAAPTPSGPRGGYVAELLDGWRFVRGERLVLAIVLTIAITNCLDAPLFSVLLPVYANTVLGSAVSLGLIVAAFGGGSMVGAVVYGAVGHRLPRRATFVGSFFLVGLPFWAFASLPPLWVAIAAAAAIGVASGPLNPLIMTVLQERVPDGMRGRVFGIVTAVAYAVTPLGMLAAGYLVEWVGLRATLVGLAACYLVVTVGMLLTPALRRMDGTDSRG
jgi:MFS family permease